MQSFELSYPSKWHLTFIAVFLTIAVFMGCAEKMKVLEAPATPTLPGTIVEIDDHGNAVTDLEIAAFTERGWKLGDTLEVTFETGQKIEIKFVENYADVPVGDYLGRFSTSSQRFKIAINRGYLAETLKLSSPSKVVLQKIEPPSTN